MKEDLRRNAGAILAAAAVVASIAACGSKPPRETVSSPRSGAVLIERVVPFADGVGTDQIRNECDFATRVPQRIVDFGAKEGVAVQLLDGDPRRAKGRVLKMQTVAVHSLPGGAVTWSKYAQVRGELREGGRLIGDFEIRRATGGAFDFTTCGALEHVGEALAASIARWLKNPQPGTRQGLPRD